MNKVYCIMTLYQGFVDDYCNEAVLSGVYATKEIALSYLKYGFLSEIDVDMVSLDFEFDIEKEYDENYLSDNIKEQIEQFGYLSFRQDIGNGRTYIYLEEKDVIDFGVIYD